MISELEWTKVNKVELADLKNHLSRLNMVWEWLFANQKKSPTKDEHDAWYAMYLGLRIQREELKNAIACAERMNIDRALLLIRHNGY